MHAAAWQGDDCCGRSIGYHRAQVHPYVCDQLAMRRLPRASFASLLSLLPASATTISFLVLRQVPTLIELAGIALVVGGVALHRTEA